MKLPIGLESHQDTTFWSNRQIFCDRIRKDPVFLEVQKLCGSSGWWPVRSYQGRGRPRSLTIVKIFLGLMIEGCGRQSEAKQLESESL